MTFDQVAILIFTSISIWALAGKHYRAGFIFGICGQPFWIYATFSSHQWGMFIVAIWFTLNHIRGLINHKNGG